MCGIAGILAYNPVANGVNRKELLRTREAMRARGPDDAGLWLSQDKRIGLAHRRLSIIDLSDRAAQPMTSADSQHVIVFNGEIYNFRSLRDRLETKGHRFRSHSDTEVLLHLYAEMGADMVTQLRGMFAFAIWDARKKMLFLARDPYGIKPLYYADDGWTFRFASQVKALLAGGNVSREPEPAGWAGFYLFGSVPDPFSTYQDIRALPAGSYLWVDKTGPGEPMRYASLAAICQESDKKAPLTQEEVREALRDSVRHHLVADVPVGAFLSAGIDSGALVGLMRDVGQERITTVTLSFEEFRGRPDDEAPLAAQVARRYGTDHHERVVTRDEFQRDLPHILEAMDQPSIDGVNTWFVAKAARELGLKVAISGLGGDELFGGYPSFRDIPRWVRLFALPGRIPLLGRGLRYGMTAGQRLFLPGQNPKAAGLLELGGTWAGAWLLRRGLFMPWELESLMGRDMAREGLRRLKPLSYISQAMTPAPKSAFAKVAVLESALYMRNQLLRDTDWASMAHSLEVRVPLVDVWLWRRLNPARPRQAALQGKALLAHAPATALPETIVRRAKTGFATPVAQWLRQDKRLGGWQRHPFLQRPGTPWARRWACSVTAA